MTNAQKGFVLLVLVGVIAGGVFWYQKNKFDPSVDQRTLTPEQLQEYWKNLSDLYEKDTYGGKTPGETLQLFVVQILVLLFLLSKSSQLLGLRLKFEGRSMSLATARRGREYLATEHAFACE